MTRNQGVIALDESTLEGLLHLAGVPRSVILRGFWVQDFPFRLYLALEHPDFPEREDNVIAERMYPTIRRDVLGDLKIDMFPVKKEWGP